MKKIDDSDANKDEKKDDDRLLNLYPSVEEFGERNDTLKLSSKYSSPIGKPSGQPDATNESKLSNKWEVENGGDSRKSQIESLNKREEPYTAKIPFPFYLFKDKSFVSSNRFSVETLFELNLSEEDIDKFLELS